MSLNKKIVGCLFVAACCFVANATTIFNNAIDSPFPNALQSPYNSPILGLSNGGIRPSFSNPSYNSFSPFSTSQLKRRCPICDSSVYGYCTDKLFHDSCCCHNPNNPYDQLPYQCQYADCTFLHANSCREHKLITACCCTNYFLYRK